jgi:hypothetical protein
MSDDDALLASFHGMLETLHALNQQAVREYRPVVEAIIRSQSRDTRHIEHTLDGLLDFCGYGPALRLYRRLCRHYFDIDPHATAEYVEAYRELWDSKAGEEVVEGGRRKTSAGVRRSRDGKGTKARASTQPPQKRSKL